MSLFIGKPCPEKYIYSYGKCYDQTGSDCKDDDENVGKIQLHVLLSSSISTKMEQNNVKSFSLQPLFLHTVPTEKEIKTKDEFNSKYSSGLVVSVTNWFISEACNKKSGSIGVNNGTCYRMYDNQIYDSSSGKICSTNELSIKHPTVDETVMINGKPTVEANVTFVHSQITFCFFHRLVNSK